MLVNGANSDDESGEYLLTCTLKDSLRTYSTCAGFDGVVDN